MLDRFKTSIGFLGLSDDCGVSNGKRSNMNNEVHIMSNVEAVNQQAFLPCLLKSRIATLSFGAQSIEFLERNAVTVNGKPVIIGKRDITWYSHDISCHCSSFLITRTGNTFGAFQRTAVLLTSSVVVGEFFILVHSNRPFANKMFA